MINSLNATLTCLLLMMAWVSCSGDEDDDDAPLDDDFDATHDDDTDDDDVDDDAGDDDDDDTWPPLPDDDDAGSAPVLSNGYWDPNPISPTQSSTLYFSVCDVDDDLSGGMIFIWEPWDDIFGMDPFWDDFVDGAPHATDCDFPASIGITVNFDGAPPGLYSFDVEATDGEGNLSNTLEDVTVEVVES